MLGNFWNLVFIQPITFSLQWLSQLTGNVGVAILVLTIIIQLLLTPLRLPSLKSAQKIKKLAPKLDELKNRFQDDKMALAQAQMDLYKEHGVNPLGGILPTLLSIPIIIALYRVLLSTLGNIEGFSTQFLWLDVTKSDAWYLLPIGVALVQFIMSKQIAGTSASVKEDKQSKEGKQKSDQGSDEVMQMVQSQMKYLFPVMSGIITASLPAGIGIYWFTSVVFAIIQQKLLVEA